MSVLPRLLTPVPIPMPWGTALRGVQARPLRHAARAFRGPVGAPSKPAGSGGPTTTSFQRQ
eukprot:9328908-Pyramimonas_sp.AAC.1